MENRCVSDIVVTEEGNNETAKGKLERGAYTTHDLPVFRSGQKVSPALSVGYPVIGGICVVHTEVATRSCE